MRKRLLLYGPWAAWPPVRKKFTSSLILFFLLLLSLIGFAQTRIITGTVRNEKTEPVSGASVFVKGTNIGTTTSPEGKFSIQLPADKRVLTISSIGYKSKELTVGDQANLDVQMEINAAEG